VALPLLPLAMLWILDLRRGQSKIGYPTGVNPKSKIGTAIIFVLAALIVVLPWTARNYAAYGALIVVDTTGAENLWLDNDPAGREAVKAQLYALGDDRAGRQRLAMRRGVEAIAADPGRFLAKARGEAQRFFALQFFDDMRERRAIWVPPHEVWLRLALGDGVWLLVLFGGIVGLWLAPECNMRHAKEGTASMLHVACCSAKWPLVPWVLYIFLTSLLFHVELRYRLPLYPALLPYAGWTLARIADSPLRGTRLQIADWRRPRMIAAATTCGVVVALMLLHRPYPAEAWTLGWKHAHLLGAERALEAGDAGGTRVAAQQALALDPESALARAALARAALLGGDMAGARAALDAAVATLPDHPRARVLRGMVLRAQGQEHAARADLAYETASLEDLQRWAWDVFPPAPLATLDVGGGLDLGYLHGFHSAEPGGFRWTRAEAEVRLAAPGERAVLELRIGAGRPAGTPPPEVIVLVDGRVAGNIVPGRDLRVYRLDIPASALSPGEQVVVALRTATFRPRDFDRASQDGRELGVIVDSIGFIRP
jgi:hypothetical protein